MSRLAKIFIVSTLIVVLILSGIGLYNRKVTPAEPEQPEQNEQPVPEETEPEEEEEEKTAAPDFVVTTYEKEEVRLSDCRGKPVVLNFWASWCGPCKSELPDFNDVYLKEKDVVFMMVNLTASTGETSDTAKAYIDKMGFEFPVYYDRTGEVMRRYNISSIPTTYLIDAEGNIVAYAVGMIDAETLSEGIDMIR